MVLQSRIPSSVEVRNQDVCVSVLRTYKLQKISLHKSCSADDCMQSCKLCGQSENVLNLLLCDRCEEAFHVSCCKPRVILPIDEWFCHSCAKKNPEGDSFTVSRTISQGIGPYQFEFGPVLGPIAAMMKYPEPFTSKVRIGEAYQAHVPDWCVEIYVLSCSMAHPYSTYSSLCHFLML